MAGKNGITLADMSLINPLIDESGDPAKIKASLKFLATAFLQADPNDGMPLDFGDCCGFGYLLQACAAAMEVSNHG